MKQHRKGGTFRHVSESPQSTPHSGAPDKNRGRGRSVLILALLVLFAPALMGAKGEIGTLFVLGLWAAILVVAIIYFIALAVHRNRQLQKRNSKYYQ